MKRARKLIFSVTNDLTYDQRMIRICTSLSRAGYDVTLVGRKLPGSVPFRQNTFHQFRIRCFFNKGFIFYAEFNFRLFFYLIYKRADLLCAIDLDTILPVFFSSVIKNVPRVYDAHELFCEMKEIVTRPKVYRFWKRIEKFAVPRFNRGYAVNRFVAAELNRMYLVQYEEIRNMPVLTGLPNTTVQNATLYIIYQGAVNEGRCFESLIPAMRWVDATLIVCGSGNFLEQAKLITAQNKLENKVIFKGWVDPDTLKNITSEAYLGVNILEGTGLNHQLSLSNRFFDYIQAGLPQVCTDFPAYREINDQYHCALLISDASPVSIAEHINRLLHDHNLYNELRNNCLTAREHLHWGVEENKLVQFYRDIFDN